MFSKLAVASLFSLQIFSVDASPISQPDVKAVTISHGISFSSHQANTTSPDDAKISKRATCVNQGAFNTDDLQALTSQLMGEGPDNNIYLPAGAISWWTLGSAQVCIQNQYWYQNTHTSPWEAGWAGSQVLNTCCSTGSACYGGFQPAGGDDGLGLQTIVAPSGEDKCGL